MPFDRPFAGRRLTAVDQGDRYAINLPCDWLIGASIRQIRLDSNAALGWHQGRLAFISDD